MALWRRLRGRACDEAVLRRKRDGMGRPQVEVAGGDGAAQVGGGRAGVEPCPVTSREPGVQHVGGKERGKEKGRREKKKREKKKKRKEERAAGAIRGGGRPSAHCGIRPVSDEHAEREKGKGERTAIVTGVGTADCREFFWEKQDLG